MATTSVLDPTKIQKFNLEADKLFNAADGRTASPQELRNRFDMLKKEFAVISKYTQPTDSSNVSQELQTAIRSYNLIVPKIPKETWSEAYHRYGNTAKSGIKTTYHSISRENAKKSLYGLGGLSSRVFWKTMSGIRTGGGVLATYAKKYRVTNACYTGTSKSICFLAKTFFRHPITLTVPLTAGAYFWKGRIMALGTFATCVGVKYVQYRITKKIHDMREPSCPLSKETIPEGNKISIRDTNYDNSHLIKTLTKQDDPNHLVIPDAKNPVNLTDEELTKILDHYNINIDEYKALWTSDEETTSTNDSSIFNLQDKRMQKITNRLEALNRLIEIKKEAGKDPICPLSKNAIPQDDKITIENTNYNIYHLMITLIIQPNPEELSVNPQAKNPMMLTKEDLEKLYLHFKITEKEFHGIWPKVEKTTPTKTYYSQVELPKTAIEIQKARKRNEELIDLIGQKKGGKPIAQKLALIEINKEIK